MNVVVMTIEPSRPTMIPLPHRGCRETRERGPSRIGRVNRRRGEQSHLGADPSPRLRLEAASDLPDRAAVDDREAELRAARDGDAQGYSRLVVLVAEHHGFRPTLL